MLARPLRKVRSVNCSNATYNALADTLTEPRGDPGTATGSVVINIAMEGQSGTINPASMGYVPTWLELWPYGLGATGNTMNVRVVAWQSVIDSSTQAAGVKCQWAPSELCEVACTLGTDTGAVNGAPLNTELYATTITVVDESTLTAATTRSGTVLVNSPGTGIRGHIRLDLEGVEKIEILFAQGGTGTPTMNALYRLYDRYVGM